MVEILHNNYQIPVYSVEDQENIINLIHSKEFNDIYSFYSEQIPRGSRLEQLPDFEKRMGFYLYYTGQEQFLNQLDVLLYKKHMPTIQEFLKDDAYMGNSYAIIYPYWRQILAKIFDPSNQYFECVTGDTEIPLMDGSVKTVADLCLFGYEGCYVYTWNEQKHSVEPGEIEGIQYSGEKRVYEITLDNGKVFKCTGNHKFLNRNNKWVLTKDLKVGDSLMPFERFVEDKTAKGVKSYEKVIIPSKNSVVNSEYTHRLSALWKYGRKYKAPVKNMNERVRYEVIHHKDGNKYNNNPTNLIYLDSKTHLDYHTKFARKQLKLYNEAYKNGVKEVVDSIKNRLRKGSVNRWSDEQQHKLASERMSSRNLQDNYASKISVAFWNSEKGALLKENLRIKQREKNLKNNPSARLDISKERFIETLKDSFSLREVERKLNCSRCYIINKLKFYNINHKDILKKVTEEEVRHILSCGYTIDECASNTCIKVKTLKAWCNKFDINTKDEIKYNHKIVSIKLLEKSESTFNVCIRGNHNFAIDSGVYASNCVFRGSIGCLSGDTKILSDNKLVSIENLASLGEDNEFNVLSYDIKNNVFVKAKAFNARCTGKNRKVLSVSLSDGTTLKCTGDHRFLLSSGHYVEAKDLRKNDILCSNSGSVTVKDVHDFDKKCEVYDIEVPVYHNFAVVTDSGNLIILHNSGKSTIARRGLIYALYRICCLRSPHKLFNIAPDTVLSALMISVTLQQAQDTALKPVLEMIRNSPCFHEVRKMTAFDSFGPNDPVPFCRQGNGIRFPNNVYLSVGSNINHIIGYSVFGSIFDEAEEKDSSEAFKLYTGLRERIRSRFLNSSLIYCALISSSKSKSGMVWEYIHKIKPDDPETLLLDPAIWEVKGDALGLSGKHFWIYIGTKTHPSKVLPEEYNDVPLDKLNYVPPAGCELLEVPIEYKREFENNIEAAIQNIAGRTTDTSDRPFDDLSRIGDCKQLLPEVHLEAPLGDQIPLIDKLPKELFQETTLGPRLARYPNAPRFCFSEDTKVKLLSGISKTMKELSDDYKNGVENFVYSWDCNKNKWCVGKIVFAGVTKSVNKLAKVTLDDGSIIKCTPDHKFLLKSGVYKPVSEIDFNESLLAIYKSDFGDLIDLFVVNHKIKSIEYIDYPNFIDVYDLTIENKEKTHNFALDAGVVVSNCHVDLASQSTSQAGYSLWHKEYIVNDLGEHQTVFVADFVSWISAPNRIDHDAIKQLSLDLRDKAGVYIKTISYDQFQSEYVRQSLQQHHEFENVRYQSVDRDITAYLNFAQWMITGRIKVGDCPYLREQLGYIGVADKKLVTTHKKDMADSCLSYDTKIFLLSGKVLTIEELYHSDIEHEWVLACDCETKQLKPVKIERVLEKYTPETLLQFTLSNGKTFACTDDHLILMKDGTYKHAEEIIPYDELMPFNYYHELNYHDRYRKVVNPFKGTSKFLYKIVSQDLLSNAIAEAKKRAVVDGSKFTVIHHKSHNKNDDRPENLVPLTNIEHTNLHAMTGREIKAFHDRTVMKRARTKIINEGLALMKQVNPEGYRRYLLKHDLGDKLAEQKSKVENLHVYVTQITRIENSKPVYDIVLNSIHNFALDCNVFVHNCVGAVNNAYLDATPVEFPYIEAKAPEVKAEDSFNYDAKRQEVIEI